MTYGQASSAARGLLSINKLEFRSGDQLNWGITVRSKGLVLGMWWFHPKNQSATCFQALASAGILGNQRRKKDVAGQTSNMATKESIGSGHSMSWFMQFLCPSAVFWYPISAVCMLCTNHWVSSSLQKTSRDSSEQDGSSILSAPEGYQVSEKSLCQSFQLKDPPFRDGPRSTLFNVIPFDCTILKWLDFLKGVKKKPLYMHQWSSEAAETAPANGQHIIPAWKFCSSNANFIAVMPPRWCQRNQWTASN